MALAESNDDECMHRDTALTRRVVRGGSVQIARQCKVCGKAVGGPVPHSTVRNSSALPAFREGLEDQYFAERRERFRRERELRLGGWWDTYRAYMESPEWKARRQLALQRDNHLCQGCLKNSATEVHHLTYERMGHELMFDLVSLCGDCHSVAHQDDDEQ